MNTERDLRIKTKDMLKNSIVEFPGGYAIKYTTTNYIAMWNGEVLGNHAPEHYRYQARLKVRAARYAAIEDILNHQAGELKEAS